MTLTGDQILEQFSSPFAFDHSAEIQAAATVVTPCLTMIGSLESEREAAIAMANIICKEYGLRTIMLSQWNGIPIPGFDGVLVNEAGVPVANLSLKELVGGQESFKKSIADAELKANRYSDLKFWAQFLLVASKGLIMRSGIWNETFSFDTEEKAELYQQRLRIAQQLAGFFGVGTGRPTWIGVQVKPNARLTVPESYIAARRNSRDSAVEKILVRFPGKMVVIHHSKILVRSVPCELLVAQAPESP